MILPSATETDPLILPSLSGFTIDRNEQVEKELEVQIEKVKQKRFRRKQFHDSQAAILGFLTPSLIASRDTPTPTDVDNAPKQETDDASPETSDPTYDPAQVLASGLTGSRELEKLHAAPESIALVVVNHNYRSLPNLPEYTAMAAWTLYSTLIDRKYGHFDHRKSRFLDNPSLVEFQDTLEFLEREAPVNSALFLYIQGHGLRIDPGGEISAGSYIAFAETSFQSELKLKMTSMSENQLAEHLHRIPSQYKLVGLEICQDQDLLRTVARENLLQGRVHADVLSHIHMALVKLKYEEEREARKAKKEELAKLAKLNKLNAKTQEPQEPQETLESRTLSQVEHDPEAVFTILLESLDVKSEVPAKDRDSGVSLFLQRLIDAFRGGAASVGALDEFHNWTEADSKFPHFHARDICDYVIQKIQHDVQLLQAAAAVEDESKKKKKRAQHDVQETCQHTCRYIGHHEQHDFQLGHVPKPPEPPEPPTCRIAHARKVTIQWNPRPRPQNLGGVILGYAVEKQRQGRVPSPWTLAGRKKVWSYEQVVKEKLLPPAQLTIRGLIPSTEYRFRLRARNAGGWSSFSIVSESVVTAHETISTSFQDHLVLLCSSVSSTGPWPIEAFRQMMLRNAHSSVCQRLVITQLAKYCLQFIHYPVRAQACLECLPRILAAMTDFPQDLELQHQASLVIGRLAQVPDMPEVVKALRSGQTGRQTKKALGKLLIEPNLSSAKWAWAQVQTTPVKRALGHNAAAMKIQRRFRQRNEEWANNDGIFSALAEELVDLETGERYYYNPETGETSWRY